MLARRSGDRCTFARAGFVGFLRGGRGDALIGGRLLGVRTRSACLCDGSSAAGAPAALGGNTVSSTAGSVHLPSRLQVLASQTM